MLKHEWKDADNQHPFFIIHCSKTIKYKLTISNYPGLGFNLTKGGELKDISLFPEDSTVKSPPDKEALRKAVYQCLDDYLKREPQDLLFFIAEDTDQRAETRAILFSRWGNLSDVNHINFIEYKINIVDEIMHTGFIFLTSEFSEDEIREHLDLYSKSESGEVHK